MNDIEKPQSVLNIFLLGTTLLGVVASILVFIYHGIWGPVSLLFVGTSLALGGSIRKKFRREARIFLVVIGIASVMIAIGTLRSFL
jgi:uncharacterized metal-binding protein